MPTRAPSRAQRLQPPAQRERPARKKSSSGGRAKFVALALILILVAVGIAILVSGTSGSGYTDINAGSPRDQAQEIINYIHEHRR